VTTALEKVEPGSGSLVRYQGSQAPAPSPENKPRRLGRWFASNPAWPITAMLLLWPVWWLLGIGEYAPVLFAIPMARRMYQWRATGSRKLKLPPGFGIWVMFLVVSVIGLATIGQLAPDTITSSVSNRLISFGLRFVSYVAVTIILLYVGNLTEKELPRRRIAYLLGMVGIYTVIGGLMGTFLPTIQFSSPLALLVPNSIQTNNTEIALMLHPSTAQVMNFLGYAEGRPTAPFTYTNMWGNSLAILLPFLIAGWCAGGTRRQRRIGIIMVVLSIVPIIYSLNRGVWLGIGLSVLYLAVRFAARGKLAMLGGLFLVLVIAALAIFASPLQSIISQRLAHGASNQDRSSNTSLALEEALASPLIGWGDTRHEVGSAQSIAIGKTANCSSCGNQSIGGNGQVQLLLITSGLLGTALYLAFFAFGAWRYRRDTSPMGMAAELVLLLSFVFDFVYDAVGPTLAFTVLAYALLWRNAQERGKDTPAVEEPAAVVPARLNGSTRAISAGTAG
jgi:polysaccharide biosynthesis protein PslJ